MTKRSASVAGAASLVDATISGNLARRAVESGVVR